MKLLSWKRFLLVYALLALFGVFVSSTIYAAPTDPVQSSSVGLEGVVPASPPTVPATIAIPLNGQTFSSLPVKVSGLCTGDLLVKLYKNEVFAGSAQCNSGSYSISIDLFNGVNDLVARVYDALDQAGPDSNKVSVTFKDTGFISLGTRVTLTSNYAKRGANPKETLSWPLILSGGVQPYAMSIDWGDGKNDLISRSSSGNFDITHIYDSPGAYIIIVKVTDSDGATAFLQIVGIANGPISQSNATKSNTTVITKIIWWPMIIAAVMVLISFWMGHKDQLRKMRLEAERRV